MHFYHVDGDGAGGLGSIHHEGDTAFFADPADLFDGIQGAGHVGGVAHDHQLCLRPDGSANCRRIRAQDRIRLHLGDRDARVFKIGQGPGHSVVLHPAGDHVIAGGEHALKTQIDGVRGVQPEDDPLGLRDVKKLGQHGTGIVDICRRRAGTFGISAARIAALPEGV